MFYLCIIVLLVSSQFVLKYKFESPLFHTCHGWVIKHSLLVIKIWGNQQIQLAITDHSLANWIFHLSSVKTSLECDPSGIKLDKPHNAKRTHWTHHWIQDLILNCKAVFRRLFKQNYFRMLKRVSVYTVCES